MPTKPVRVTLVIKRLRTEWDDSKKWVAIGKVVVNLGDSTGAIYLNHLDETWRLFPRQDAAAPREES